MSGEGPVERHLEVGRTARFCTLGPWKDDGRPAGPGAATPVREVWFVLHGYGQLAGRFLRRFAPVDDGSRLVVAPEGLSRFYVKPTRKRHGPESLVGATWMTREDREREIEDYVAYLDRLAALVEVRVGGCRAPTTVLGFSQGGHTAARWAVLGEAGPPDRLVLWGSYFPPDLDMELAASRLDAVDVTLVRGSEDRSLEPELDAAEEARLDAAGIRRHVRRYDGGHDIDPAVLTDLT